MVFDAGHTAHSCGGSPGFEPERKQGVRRVVYTSSVATMGFGSNGNGGASMTEAHLTDEDSPVSL